jgi:hypothetical protein
VIGLLMSYRELRRNKLEIKETPELLLLIPEFSQIKT